MVLQREEGPFKDFRDGRRLFHKGYDSDGELSPFWGVLKQEGEQLFEEQPLGAPEETTTAATALVNAIEPGKVLSMRPRLLIVVRRQFKITTTITTTTNQIQLQLVQ